MNREMIDEFIECMHLINRGCSHKDYPNYDRGAWELAENLIGFLRSKGGFPQ